MSKTIYIHEMPEPTGYGVDGEQESVPTEKKIVLTAYQKTLLERADGDRVEMAYLLFSAVMQHEEAAIQTMKLSGSDEVLNINRYYIVADLLMEAEAKG